MGAHEIQGSEQEQCRRERGQEPSQVQQHKSSPQSNSLKVASSTPGVNPFIQQAGALAPLTTATRKTKQKTTKTRAYTLSRDCHHPREDEQQQKQQQKKAHSSQLKYSGTSAIPTAITNSTISSGTSSSNSII